MQELTTAPIPPSQVWSCLARDPPAMGPALACIALGLIDVADETGVTLLHMACQRGLEVRSIALIASDDL